MEKLIEIKEKIKKINLFIDAIDSNEFSKIEKDILLEKIRNLYLFVIEEAETKTAANVEKTIESVKSDTIVRADIKTEPAVQEVKPVVVNNDLMDFVDDDEVEEQKPEPVSEVIVQVPEKNEENSVKISNTETVIPKKPVVEQASLFGSNGSEIKTLGEQLGQNKTSLNDSLAGQKANMDVSSRIGHKPITDIKSAIGVGDRFLFIRELFGGSNESFEETITHLNSLQAFDQANSYLINKFNWDESKQTVNSFINIVKRKYL